MNRKILSAALGTLALTLTITPLAQAATFIRPTIGGRYIDSCLTSFRFQDGCNKAAAGEIAHQFCRWNGYSGWAQWQTRKSRKREPHIEWQEKYVDGRLIRGFYPIHDGYGHFNVIQCR